MILDKTPYAIAKMALRVAIISMVSNVAIIILAFRILMIH